MKRRLFSVVLAICLMIGLLPISSAALQTVSSLEMPYKETWLTADRQNGNGEYSTDKYSMYYYGSPDFVPALYTSLTGYSNGSAVEITNIKWKCETDFDIAVCGDYVFSIDTYEGAVIPDSVIEANKVTVHVIENLITKRSANFYLNGVPVRAKMLSTTAMKFYDLTGTTVMPILNIAGMYINPANFTAENVIVFAGENTETCDDDAFLWVDDCSLKAVYCGGNYESAVYTGDATIIVTGTSSIGDFYGGGVNGAHNGNTTVSFSGGSNVTGTFSAGGVGCAMTGKTTLKISDSSIFSKVTKGSASEFDVDVSDNYNVLNFDVAGSGADMYRDGQKMTVIKELKLVSVEGTTHIGTPINNIAFSSFVEAVTDSGSTVMIDNVGYVSDSYDPYTVGTYDFDIVLPKNYCLYSKDMIPDVSITVDVTSRVTVDSIELPESVTHLTLSDKAPEFYDTLKAYTTVNGRKVAFELKDLKWTSSDFKPNTEGKYTFTIDKASLKSNYGISSSLLSRTKITANVSENGPVLADGVITAPYAVSVTEADGKYYRLRDITGCNDLNVQMPDGSYSMDKHSSEYALKADRVSVYGGVIKNILTDDIFASGGVITNITAGDKLTAVIEDAAEIKGNIDLNSVTTRSTLTVPYRNVRNVKYPQSLASLVEINGENMGSNKAEGAETSGENVFCNGIPAYIDRAADSETYLYRSSDDTLLLSEPVTYKTVYGGANGATVQNTNIVIDGGMVGYIYGGGMNNGDVTDTAVYIHNAGTVRFSARGGGNYSNIGHLYCEVNEGYVGKSYLLGGARSVIGTPDSKDVTATLIWNGGACRDVYLGNTSSQGVDKNTIYGTTKFVMNGGNIDNLIEGMTVGICHSDFDITVNAGMIAESLKQDGIRGSVGTGHSDIKVYKEFDDALILPTDPARLTVRHMKDTSYVYEYAPYVVDNSVFDTSADKGNLTVRYIDMRLDSEPIDSTYLPTKTGDSALVTFPDGTLMLIDTGIVEASSVLIRTLKKLGVTKLDYIVVSHFHNDHTGGFENILKNFEVKNVILPNFTASYNGTYTSTIASLNKYPAVNRIYLRAGDKLNISGVNIDVYNPDTEYADVPTYETADANNYSLLMKFTYGSNTLLTTGDLYEAQEKILSEKYTNGELKADVLKIMHHGHMTSCYYKFYELISPTYAIMPCTMSRKTDMLCTAYTIEDYFRTPYLYVLGDTGIVKVVMTGDSINVTQQYNYAFTDVDNGAWYADYVNYVSDNSLMGGTGAFTFEPNAGLTRGMFATILARYDGSDTSVYANTFSDVASGSWYAQSVAWASANGIAGGTGDSKFEPERLITRQEMAVMIKNYLEYRGVSANVQKSSYSDYSSIASWAADAVDYCTAIGILGGTDGRFEPAGTTTRAQAAAIFTRLDK